MAQNTKAFRIGALTGMVAAVSMAASPAHAAEMPLASSEAGGSAFGLVFSEEGAVSGDWYAPGAEQLEYHRWRRGWGRGWRGGWRGRRGIRGGDVLAGVLVLGGIAAIASAASNNRRRDRDVVIVERDRVRDRDDRRYDDRRSNPRASTGSGLDNAVSICLDEIERDVRVDSVDNASRTPSGWVVSGTLFNGAPFNCRIDNNGRVSGVDYSDFRGVNFESGETVQPAEGQWSDDRYREARAQTGDLTPNATATLAYADEVETNRQPLNAASANEPQPAYPGGPLPGEEGYPED
ncbi:hypothetical protein [Erythrobacter sp. KY5]|uniref:hypothetical protein n=1 Tax=Erythrobacter sp. KY5 TaxID=2011159 RepID=UPI0018F87AF7|nr:hypothetical protein [Erythrobacter sp. KY5]